MHVFSVSVVAGILSASHRIGRHVVSVSSANEVEPAEPSSTHDGKSMAAVFC